MTEQGRPKQGTPAQNSATDQAPETSPIFRLIRQVRQLLRSSWVATGLGLTVGLFLITLLVLSTLDLLNPLWTSLRWIALALVVVPAVWVAIVGVIRPVLRRLGNGQVARRIETHLPGIHNRLVSCVDLEDENKRKHRSPEFYRRLVTEALDRIKSFRAKTVLDLRSLRRAGILAGSAIGIFLLAWILLSDRLPTAMARIFRPWADIPPATGVEFSVKPGTKRVLRGDDIRILAEVTKGQPEDLRIEILPADGSATIWHDLRKLPKGRFTRTLQGLEFSFAYRIHGGGTWSKRFQITMVDRPRIVALQTAVHYPAYLGMDDPQVSPQQTADVTGPEESQVEVLVDVEGDVAQGEIQFVEPRMKTVRVKPEDREERVWFEDKVPEGAVVEGPWQWDSQQHGKPVHGEPAAPGVHGHLFHTAPIPFEVREGELLFAYVYIVPPSADAPPDQRMETILLQWNDGQSMEHRAYWGADKIGVGQPNTASRYHAGELPEVGKWVRLEVPAKAVDLEGKSLRGMAFGQHGGQCFWYLAGAVPPAEKQVEELAVIRRFAMQPGKKGKSSRKKPKPGSNHGTSGSALASHTTARWVGKFPLMGEGLYRVEFRNDLDAPNQAMQEARYVAIPDNPPQVVLERPGTDLTLSEPRKVPLVIAAYDDFALKDLVVLVQKGDSGGFRGSPIKTYKKPTRSDSVTMALDLAPYELKPGEFIRYRVECRDRKEQIAMTQDYVVRIAQDDNAADKQLARFDQTQDTFQEKLVQLISEQAKVQQAMEKINAKYEPLENKLEKAEAEAQAKAKADAQATQQPTQPVPPLTLDPETAKQLAELQQELAQAAAQQEQNANLGKQLAAELQQAADQAAQLQMLTPELQQELRDVQQAFQEMAVQPMQDLATDLRQQSTAPPADPDLGQLEQFSDRLQEELEAVAERLAALDRAREQEMAGNLEDAIAQLREEMLQQQADASARGIEDLKQALAALRERLENLENREAGMLRDTDVVSDALLPELEKQQDLLDEEAEPALADARQLLDDDKPQRMPRRPQFPDAPYDGEGEEYLVPPAEEDTDEPAAEQAGDEKTDGKTDEAAGDPAEEEEEEPLFEPALGGDQPKMDPRFEKMIRPVEHADQEGKAGQENATSEQRQELAGRQRERLQELDLSRQALGSDQQALEDLLDQLEQAMQNQENGPQDQEAQAGDEQGEPGKDADPSQKEGQKEGKSKSGKGKNGKSKGEKGKGEKSKGEKGNGEQGKGQSSEGQEPGEGGEDAPEDGQPMDADAQARLAALLQSPLMQQALAMAERLRQLENADQPPADQANQGQPSARPPRSTRPGRSFKGNMAGTTLGGPIASEELAKLDPNTRTMILKLQPRVREELLQGMREQGPEGYRQFIRDYFKRLTTVKGTSN